MFRTKKQDIDNSLFKQMKKDTKKNRHTKREYVIIPVFQVTDDLHIPNRRKYSFRDKLFALAGTIIK